MKQQFSKANSCSVIQELLNALLNPKVRCYFYPQPDESSPFFYKRCQNLGFKVFTTAVVMEVAIFWDIPPCSPYMKQRFG
jgi:hypothetical protein